MNEWSRKVFIEQPLASPGSANNAYTKVSSSCSQWATLFPTLLRHLALTGYLGQGSSLSVCANIVLVSPALALASNKVKFSSSVPFVCHKTLVCSSLSCQGRKKRNTTLLPGVGFCLILGIKYIGKVHFQWAWPKTRIESRSRSTRFSAVLYIWERTPWPQSHQKSFSDSANYPNQEAKLAMILYD